MRAIWDKQSFLVFRNMMKLSEVSERNLNVFGNFSELLIPNFQKHSMQSLTIQETTDYPET